MYLQNENIIIRNATEKDAITLCQWWNDGKIMAHAGFPKGLRTTVENIITELSQDNDYKRRLIIETNSIPIGERSYRKISEGTVEIGIKICDITRQEKGLGTKLLKMFINYLFQEMDFNKIVLDTNLNNKRAQHVYEKIGFKKIGVRINSWQDQMGILQSAVDYELTKY